MKKLLIIIILVFVNSIGFSQILYHTGFGGFFPSAPDGTTGTQNLTIYTGICPLPDGGKILNLDISASTGGSLSSGTFTINGNITSAGSTSLTVSSGATLVFGSSSATSTTTIVLNSGATMDVQGSFTNYGTITVKSGATLIVANSITNNGTVVVESGGNLIQTGSGSASGTYSIAVNGHSSSTRYNLWSSPVSSSNVTSTFSASNPCDISVFEAGTQMWGWDLVGNHTCNGTVYNFDSENIPGADGVMDISRGYTVTGGGNRKFSGTINNGTKTIDVTANGTTNPDWTGSNWNLLGNPYPSSISASTFLSLPSNSSVLNGTVYFWDDDNSNGGGYDGDSDFATWNLAGGSGSASGGGGSGETPNGSIAVGQGFFVQASSTGTVSFTNAMRGGGNSQFFKTDDVELIERVWINATSSTGRSSQILVAFTDNATDGVDWGYDSERLVANTDFIFGSRISMEDNPFVIQSLSKVSLEIEKEVPISLFSAIGGVTTVAVNNTENFDSTIVVYLKDYKTGKLQNLFSGPFAVYLNKNQTYNTRFSLVFVNESGPVPSSIHDISQEVLNIYLHNNILYIKSDAHTLKNFEIVNINGVAVMTGSLNSCMEKQVDLNDLIPGMYIVNVITDESIEVRSKFIVQ